MGIVYVKVEREEHVGVIERYLREKCNMIALVV
jgi:hypothetical protein